MRHGPNDSDAARLLQWQSLVMVLQEHNRLLVQLSCQLNCLGAVDQILPLGFRGSRIRLLKQPHLKFDAEHSRHCCVDSRNVQFPRFYQLWNFLEVARDLLDGPERLRGDNGAFLQGTTSHLNIDSSSH